MTEGFQMFLWDNHPTPSPRSRSNKLTPSTLEDGKKATQSDGTRRMQVKTLLPTVNLGFVLHEKNCRLDSVSGILWS